MITPKQKEMLFKLWNHLGVSMQSPKYLDISFPNPQEFKYLVAQFYGLKRDNPTDTLIALEQDIKQKSNVLVKRIFVLTIRHFILTMRR